MIVAAFVNKKPMIGRAGSECGTGVRSSGAGSGRATAANSKSTST